jgi:hypothetical protein
MPARSNDFQAVVYFVKAHLDPDVIVTESASLPDRTTGETREVDVLLVAQVAGHLIHIGVECRDRRRKADVTWVEEMHGKHADLPTNRLVLVSASGFTKTAAIKARHYNIEAVTPERPIAQDGPLARLRNPLADLHNITHQNLVAIHGQVELDAGQLHDSELTLDHVLFTADGTEDVSVRRGDLVTHAWRHSPGRVRTGLKEFLSVSRLSILEQQLLRERYRCDDDEA